MDKLIDTVLDQIQQDVNMGDLTAIEELLRATSERALVAFLPEEKQAKFLEENG